MKPILNIIEERTKLLPSLSLTKSILENNLHLLLRRKPYLVLFNEEQFNYCLSKTRKLKEENRNMLKSEDLDSMVEQINKNPIMKVHRKHISTVLSALRLNFLFELNDELNDNIVNKIIMQQLNENKVSVEDLIDIMLIDRNIELNEGIVKLKLDFFKKQMGIKHNYSIEQYDFVNKICKEYSPSKALQFAKLNQQFNEISDISKGKKARLNTFHSLMIIFKIIIIFYL